MVIKPLRIGFDGRILYGLQRGMARYTHNLIINLSHIVPQNQYIIYTDRPLDADFSLHPNINIRLLRRHSFWSNTALANAAKADRLDLMHFPSNTCWLRPVCPTIVTLHDINPLLDERFGRKNRLLYIGYLLIMGLVTNRILTVSRASASTIATTIPYLKNRLAIVHSGLSPEFETVTYQSRSYLAPIFTPYLLFIGGCDPNKNLLSVIKALSHLNLPHFAKLELKVIGACADSHYSSEVVKTLHLANLDHRVHFLGRVSDEELISLYRGANALVFPSYCEGFGFPVLEAMACGAPVIATKTSSVPELVGDAGLLVDPYNVAELAEAINRILTDSNLVKCLRSRGQERVRRFTWEKTALQTAAIYRQVARSS